MCVRLSLLPPLPTVCDFVLHKRCLDYVSFICPDVHIGSSVSLSLQQLEGLTNSIVMNNCQIRMSYTSPSNLFLVCISQCQEPTPHKFKTTTYLHPTWCNHCGSLLYGLMKQGKQCTDCGINVHHRCQENVPKTCGHQQRETRGRLQMTVRSEEIDDEHIRLHIGSEWVGGAVGRG